MKRFPFLFLLLIVANLNAADGGCVEPAARRQPNVVLIITDDQGHGDLGFHGNPKISTPHLDQLAREAVRLDYFYVSPVCAPTRASLMTGRYNYRTGVVDTYIGRALMDPKEVTLAEMLGEAGYRTGIFGKWHLGDNHPMRPQDNGFQETFVIKGGGLGQPSDLPGGSSYHDPIVLRNGKPTRAGGYCSDVFTDAAMQFVENNAEKPFFAYIAFNAPHGPLEVPNEKLLQKYRSMNLAPEQFTTTNRAAKGHPIGKMDSDVTAKVYAMVENVDSNIGRLLAKLDALRLTRDTIVVFLTDNGPQQPRYNSGMFQLKGTVYEGGIHVPCFVRWPGQLQAGRSVDRIAAHIDIAPTLLDLCGVKPPVGVKFDGLSLAPLLRGQKIPWPDRSLYLQWHRGDAPELHRCFAARSQEWKLLQPLGNAEGKMPQPVYKLFNMRDDPLESKDLASTRPEIVARLLAGYEAWFKDVTGSRDYTVPPTIDIGSAQENPVLLTRQDWRGTRAGWTPKSLGHWEVNVLRAGDYHVTVRFRPTGQAGRARVLLAGESAEMKFTAEATEVQFNKVKFPMGKARLNAELMLGNEIIGIGSMEVRLLD